ncbi:MAG: hypothetical protein WC867_01315 [Candidatus Pacearchaeota archaeon]|jgi:hypothetical protein
MTTIDDKVDIESTLPKYGFFNLRVYYDSNVVSNKDIDAIYQDLQVDFKKSFGITKYEFDPTKRIPPYFDIHFFENELLEPIVQNILKHRLYKDFALCLDIHNKENEEE